MTSPNLRLLDVLTTMARQVVSTLDADGCAISRAIGDVLILVAEHAPDGVSLQGGQGYLVSDFPETAAVLRTREPRALSLDDPDIDPSEGRVLRDLGFGALLMLPLELRGNAWGLVEVYRRESHRPFDEADTRLALELIRVT
jgi:GAF domain-containing protein